MKQFFTLSIFLLATLLSFAQGKGKDKDKTKAKQKTEVKSTVPAPAGQTTKPEVNTKQKPQIYQKADTTKTGSQTSQGGNAINPSAASESKNNNNNAGSGTQSGGQTQTTATGESVLGQSSNSGAQPQSGQNNSSATGQTSAESYNIPVGSNQGESKKEEGKQKDKLKDSQNGKGNGNSKTRINIPTQVRNSFNADYPNAVNTVWTKNRGDWTVTFGHGIWNSTATYHSNGERVDTRTRVRKDQTPRPVQDEIFKRFPQTNPKDIIKIEKPKNPNLFQVVVEQAGKKKTLVFDEKGKLISQQ